MPPSPEGSRTSGSVHSASLFSTLHEHFGISRYVTLLSARGSELPWNGMDPQRETPKKNNTEHLIADRWERIGVCCWVLVSLSFFLVLITFPISIWACIKILTKDAVTAQVDGVVYYRIHRAVSAMANITDVHSATFLLAQTTLRNVLSTQSLAELLAAREEMTHSIRVILNSATEQWGIKVALVEIKDVRIPVAMQMAMAAKAEAAQEARAKAVAAEGEMNASKALKQASMVPRVSSRSSSALPANVNNLGSRE